MPTRSALGSYNSYVGNTVYATVATPTAPMDQPWVGVLDDACTWAKGTSDASVTTTPLLGANALPPTATYPKVWSYHQFTNAYGSIFDGSVRLGGTTTVENLSGPALGSNYYNAFIASTRHADPNKDWSPVNPLLVDVRNNKP